MQRGHFTSDTAQTLRQVKCTSGRLGGQHSRTPSGLRATSSQALPEHLCHADGAVAATLVAATLMAPTLGSPTDTPHQASQQPVSGYYGAAISCSWISKSFRIILLSDALGLRFPDNPLKACKPRGKCTFLYLIIK